MEVLYRDLENLKSLVSETKGSADKTNQVIELSIKDKIEVANRRIDSLEEAEEQRKIKEAAKEGREAGEKEGKKGFLDSIKENRATILFVIALVGSIGTVLAIVIAFLTLRDKLGL